MARIRHLSRAPIKEAIIDIQVVLPKAISTEDLDRGASVFKTDYPIKNELKQGKFDIRLDQEQALSTNLEQKHTGFRYSSSDNTQVVQFRLNGFTFSRLEPYQTWSEMKQEAMRLWDIYVDTATPVKISRVATRYINVMRIPLPIVEFSDVLTASPQIPDDLPQGVSSFFSRVVSQNHEINATAIVIQAFDTTDNNYAPIMLDIDVFANSEFAAEESGHWDCLDKLRGYKNDIFFKNITEATAELFK